MGTLKTTINLTSADTLPFALNQTTISSGSIGNIVESGVLIAKNYGDAPVFSSKKSGPNGSYLFVQSKATNTTKVKLYGEAMPYTTTDDEWPVIESFATLKPGDSMLIPLTPQLETIKVVAVNGTADVYYYIADRGGDFGSSGILFFDNTSGYQYVVQDAELGEVLPVGIHAPEQRADFGFTVADWSYGGSLGSIDIIHNKGYVVNFSSGSTNQSTLVSPRGNTTTFFGGQTYLDSWNLENAYGKVVYWGTPGDLHLVHTDGTAVYEILINGSDINLRTDFDDVASTGAFIIDVSDYDGVAGDTATILINKDKSYVLQLLNYSDNFKLVDHAAVYMYGNFVYIAVYDDNIGYYDRIQIWNTEGILLKDLDLLDQYSGDIGYLDYYIYGTNKIAIIVNQNEYILHYNGTTNHLTGWDASGNTLTYALPNNGGGYRMYAYNKYPTNSIRPWEYLWNSGLFDAESFIFVTADSIDNLSSRHLNSELDYCDFVYMLDGDTDFRSYSFADDDHRYIRLPDVYDSTSHRLTPMSNLIAFNWNTTGATTGSMNVLTLTKAGVSSSSIIPQLSTVSNWNGAIQVKPIGDYVLYVHKTYGSPNTTTFTMVKSATVKDSITVNGDNRFGFIGGGNYTSGVDGMYDSRCNSLLITNYYDKLRQWYFNTTTNKFVELGGGNVDYSSTTPVYNQSYINLSTTPNGLNDGNILLGPQSGEDILASGNWNGTGTGPNNDMRLLKRGVVTSNVKLPACINWVLRLGSEAVFFIYMDPTTGDTILKVYDLNLSLKRTLNLGNSSGWDAFNVVGKRAYVKATDVDPLDPGNGYVQYYMVSLADTTYHTSPINTNIYLNDHYWRQYEF